MTRRALGFEVHLDHLPLPGLCADCAAVRAEGRRTNDPWACGTTRRVASWPCLQQASRSSPRSPRGPASPPSTERRGELSFRLGKREIGHLHGDRSAHFAFPREVAQELRAAGRVGPHPAFPEHPKLAARSIAGADDVADVIAMLRMNYDREVARTPAGAA